MPNQLRISAALLVGLTFALTGCGKKAAEQPAAPVATEPAAEEKVLNVYNWADYIDPKVIEDFQAATGIKVQYDVFDSNEVLETKLLTGNSGYDVVVPSAYFLERQVKANVFRSLDKSKLPNLSNLDPDLQAVVAHHDPGNEHSVIYLWGTTGIGYNVDKVKKVMSDAPVDSWKLILDPAVIAKFKNCGVSVLEDPTDMVATTLLYFGKDPHSQSEEDLKFAEEKLLAIRPYVRKINSSQYTDDLANGDICIAVGYSGDVLQARDRAEEAGKGTKIAYSIPKEGALMWFDSFVIPKDAGNVDAAMKFIDFVNRPAMAAKNSDFIQYANGNIASKPLLSAAVRDNPGIYPSDAVMARLYTITPYDQKAQRLVNRLWTRVKTGK
jgi:putrescine transport system substrate-binding protein